MLRHVTSAWLNRLSIAAQLAAIVPGLLLFGLGAGISFSMSQRDPFPNAENAAVYALFCGLIVSVGVGFLSRMLALGLMLSSLLIGVSIVRNTGCLGLGSQCAPFTLKYFGWEYLAAACLTLLSMLLRVWARRRPDGNGLIENDARYSTLRYICLIVVALWILSLVVALATGTESIFGAV
jgi:hypothetical protein